jgi:uncharacterized OB-fold protein
MTAPSGNRPVPTPEERSTEFFKAAKEGRLLIKRCAACGRFLAPQREMCDACSGERLEWVEASGRGTLYSFVVMHQILHPGFRDEGPYNVVMVELDEGPRIISNVVGTANSEIRAGMRVEAVFEELTEDVSVPKFRVLQS